MGGGHLQAMPTLVSYPALSPTGQAFGIELCVLLMTLETILYYTAPSDGNNAHLLLLKMPYHWVHSQQNVRINYPLLDHTHTQCPTKESAVWFS